MKEKKWTALLVIFFLAQGVASSPVLSFENSPLNPRINIDVNYFESALYEGAIADPAMTFQALPSINEILSDCKIKPLKFYYSYSVSRSL